MIKQDLIDGIIERTGTERAKAGIAVETIFETLKAALLRGERIELRGFGVFSVKKRKSGIGRNPKTGASVPITEGRAIRFKPGKELRPEPAKEAGASSDE